MPRAGGWSAACETAHDEHERPFVSMAILRAPSTSHGRYQVTSDETERRPSEEASCRDRERERSETRDQLSVRRPMHDAPTDRSSRAEREAIQAKEWSVGKAELLCCIKFSLIYLTHVYIYYLSRTTCM